MLCRDHIYTCLSRKAVKTVMGKVQTLSRLNRNQPLEVLLHDLNLALRGVQLLLLPTSGVQRDLRVAGAENVILPAQGRLLYGACHRRSGAHQTGSDDWAMMRGRAASTGLSQHDQRAYAAPAVALERPGQRRGNSGPAPPDHGPQRQLHGKKIRFTSADRAFLAALLHRLPRHTLRGIRLLVRPETVLRWHRNLIARRHAMLSRPKQAGRPPIIRSIRWLVLRLARENDTWGYRRIHGELLVLGVEVAASTVWEILHEAGIDPAPQRRSATWATFLRSQARAIVAADFFETTTVTGARLHVLAIIEHATRAVRVLGATAHPTEAWVAQAARNLVMDLDDAGRRVKYLIRDRDGKYPAAFDAILADTGITVVLSGVRMPRMNSIMERWIQSCRHELLDRTLIWNRAHLLHALREYENHHNGHRPHRGIANARPLQPLPEPITDTAAITHLQIRRHDRLGGLLHEYEHAA
jgi:putative transposase